jgi:hypothetical protein
MNYTNKIVLGMCTTSRHDFGLNKDPDSLLSSGMTDQERDSLYSRMDQLYRHNVLPVISALEYEIDGMTDEVATLKAERDKLMAELRFARDQVQTYQNNGRFY